MSENHRALQLNQSVMFDIFFLHLHFTARIS